VIKSISIGAQYVTLQKYFSHPSLVIYFFPTPPIKLKLGLQIHGRLLIPTHMDQSNYLTNQQQVNSRCYALLRLAPASANCAKMLGQTDMF